MDQNSNLAKHASVDLWEDIIYAIQSVEYHAQQQGLEAGETPFDRAAVLASLSEVLDAVVEEWDEEEMEMPLTVERAVIETGSMAIGAGLLMMAKNAKPLS